MSTYMSMSLTQGDGDSTNTSHNYQKNEHTNNTQWFPSNYQAHGSAQEGIDSFRRKQLFYQFQNAQPHESQLSTPEEMYGAQSSWNFPGDTEFNYGFSVPKTFHSFPANAESYSMQHNISNTSPCQTVTSENGFNDINGTEIFDQPYFGVSSNSSNIEAGYDRKVKSLAYHQYLTNLHCSQRQSNAQSIMQRTHPFNQYFSTICIGAQYQNDNIYNTSLQPTSPFFRFLTGAGHNKKVKSLAYYPYLANPYWSFQKQSKVQSSKQRRHPYNQYSSTICNGAQNKKDNTSLYSTPPYLRFKTEAGHDRKAKSIASHHHHTNPYWGFQQQSNAQSNITMHPYHQYLSTVCSGAQHQMDKTSLQSTSPNLRSITENQILHSDHHPSPETLSHFEEYDSLLGIEEPKISIDSTAEDYLQVNKENLESSPNSNPKAPSQSSSNECHGLDYQPIPCPECKQNMPNDTIFLGHMAFHMSDAPWLCPLCLESFNEKLSLTTHVIHFHGFPEDLIPTTRSL